MQRGRDSRDTGAVAIEFALLMAFMPLTVLVFGIVDYGEVMVQATNLSAIVRGAAEYTRGEVVLGNGLPPASKIGALLNVPGAVFTTSTFCTCADNSTPSPLPACPAPPINPCMGSDPRLLQYVAVSGSQTYTPLVSGLQNLPGSVSARTVLRTQ
jgi:hypothetical protein